MAQVKIFGLRRHLAPLRARVSETVHSCVMEALGMPPGKRAHRFFCLEGEDFLRPEGRSDRYTILEIHLIAGRSKPTRKRLVRLLFERFSARLGIEPTDLEIEIVESGPENWGFRGEHGDEIALDYRIDV